MHYSDDDIHSQGSLSKRYVWGRIRQVQSDSDQGSIVFTLSFIKFPIVVIVFKLVLIEVRKRCFCSHYNRWPLLMIQDEIPHEYTKQKVCFRKDNVNSCDLGQHHHVNSLVATFRIVEGNYRAQWNHE